ncbi:MAG: alanine racemase [Candidatus Omnitrophica bacterium CG07_land_8_20_14_0_80_42_15]|uniref:Alanine racemase n=1 Tax=Candidatus Aquitaenariimonas noxiae TaxID=1974741 RepID=A0A2J0L1Y3_9BACT|nr:MAG: alanine racemase [Candidatus Omnitrophica bacterium CG07_land_8_20_14_0_80_42_15]
MKPSTYRPTVCEIDLSAIKHNLNEIKKLINPSTAVMAVVKANAYGHGIVEVSKILSKSGVNYLGVATVDEAVAIREANIKTPILVLGSILPSELEPILNKDITLTLCTNELLKALDAAPKGKRKIKVHVKVDTGMGRIGIWYTDAVQFIKEVLKRKHLEVEGIYTHFSSAGRDKFFTQYQFDSFRDVLKDLRERGIEIKYKHAANSIGTIGFLKSHLNLVRPGLIIYGMYPKRGFANKIKLKPALSLKTKIVYLKETPPGRSISYGRTYITERHTKIATLPIGYGDGYGRILSNKGEVLVRGMRAPVVGKVTMDQTMINVGQIKDVKIGDDVVLIGKQRDDTITAEELARLCSTIPYEIVCAIGSRVPRLYKN